jgi:hypothetical protein
VLVEKKDVCAYKQQYPCASQQNIANYICLLWGKPMCWPYSEWKNSFNFPLPPLLRQFRGEQSVALQRELTVS